MDLNCGIIINMENCIFCKIIKGESPSYKVWEDDKHLAFLSIFPNTEGTTVVIPKAHYPSYAFDLPDEVLSELVVATKKVAKLLDFKLEDVGRTAMVFEGFGVDHVHSKLFPMHGTENIKEWKPIESKVDKYFHKYEGYVSSHDYEREDDAKLDSLAKKIKG
jgi:histidine triad (HIT) family protein